MNPYESPGEVKEQETAKKRRWWQFTPIEWIVIVMTTVIVCLILLPPVVTRGHPRNLPPPVEQEELEITVPRLSPDSSTQLTE